MAGCQPYCRLILPLLRAAVSGQQGGCQIVFTTRGCQAIHFLGAKNPSDKNLDLGGTIVSNAPPLRWRIPANEPGYDKLLKLFFLY